MKYRRALFLVDPAAPSESSWSLLRSVTPRLESLLIVVPWSTSSSWWAWGSETEASRTLLDELRVAMADAADRVAVQSLPTLGHDAVVALCEAEEIELIVLGSRNLLDAVVRRRRLPIAVLWPGDAAMRGRIARLVAVVRDVPGLAAMAAFLRDHAEASMHATLLAPPRLAFDVDTQLRPVSGIAASVEIATLDEAITFDEWLIEWASEGEVDLVVVVGPPTPGVFEAHAAPLLLVPMLPIPRSFGLRTIDVPDLVDDGGPLRVRIEQGGPVGGPSPLVEQAIAFVSGGRVIARVSTDAIGETELPAGLGLVSLGVVGAGTPELDEPLAAIEQLVGVLRPEVGPLVVFDAELSDAALDRLLTLPFEVTPRFVAVRARPTRTSRSIRDRLRLRFGGAARVEGQAAWVLDLRTLLDEGEALDVVEAFDAVRLARGVGWLQRAGFRVDALAYRGTIGPRVDDCLVVSEAALAKGELDLQPSVAAEPSESLSSGNRVEVELDNQLARGWLLDAIASSRERLHLQVYIVSDDALVAEVEAELVAAAARGVVVRLLVDSLHALHGSFGTRNPVLERLATAPGVELRLVHPITEIPSLADLKLRDHRKLVVRDGALALIGGRNLALEYYTGFDEVVIGPTSTWRDLPWLDGGARITGPAVAAIERGFLRAWVEAGGQPFAIVEPPPVGDATLRVIEHRGLRDASTHEAYRALIEGARERIDLVLGFPLALELQRALLHALARGVAVRVLVGRPAPSQGGVLLPGPWAAARTAANELVHSRLDPLFDAGATGYLLIPHPHERAKWAPELGTVHPHVHAKLMVADAARFALGSANPDITSAYWESELLIVVDDVGLAGSLVASIDARIADSLRIDPRDEQWRALVRRRAWMRHWPSLFSA